MGAGVGIRIRFRRPERRTSAYCMRPIRGLTPSLERQTRARGKAPDRWPDVTRLSDSSGDRAMTKTGLHPMPDDSHGACRPTPRQTMATATFGEGGTPHTDAAAASGVGVGLAAFVVADRSTAACVCVPQLSTLRAPCEFSRPARKPLRRRIASGQSEAFPRARVCLSKPWERPRIGRLQCQPS